MTRSYVGRFAPSPTGKLHFGSLVAALASYLDAKANDGLWLVRMENLDPPREETGAADSILRSLEAHQLYWDESILWQSSRIPAYQQALEKLQTYLYECNCIRQRIRELGGRYDNYCRKHIPTSTPTATRIRIDVLDEAKQQKVESFSDLFLGPQNWPLANIGDFILKRKDGLFAYQLAVAVDDHHQGITHVVRGLDLLDSTSRQRYLLSLFNAPLPNYGHTPLALGADGDKLSKQTQAKPLDNNQAENNLINALTFLNHPPPKEIKQTQCRDLLNWAIQNWQRSRVPKQSYLAPTENNTQ